MQYSQEQLQSTIFRQTQLDSSFRRYFIVSRPQGEAQSASFIQSQLGRNWTKGELERFALFLHFQCEYIDCGDLRKANRIFALMSKYVKTRNLNQCRNFSLKMIRKYGSQQKVKEFFAQSLPNWQKIKQESLDEIEAFQQSNGQSIKMLKREGFRCVHSMDFRGQIGSVCFSQAKDQQLKPTDSEYQLQKNENVCFGKSRRQQSHLLKDTSENKHANIYSELSRHFMGGLMMCSNSEGKTERTGIDWKIINEKEKWD